MFKVKFGNPLPNTVDKNSALFGLYFLEEWLSDHFIREMIRDIDGCNVVDACVISPVLGQIPAHYLSGGTKNMMMLYKGVYDDEGRHFNMMYCGGNCLPWLCKIGEMRDIEVSCTTYDHTFDDIDVYGYCMNDDTYFRGYKEWCRKLLKYGN